MQMTAHNIKARFSQGLHTYAQHYFLAISSTPIGVELILTAPISKEADPG